MSVDQTPAPNAQRGPWLRHVLPGDGRGWCYFGMLLGGSISVYANVAQKYVRYDAPARAWVPHPDPALDGVLLAAAAPVAVWVMLEILIRVTGGGWRAWVGRLSAAVVALVAFVTSFQHLHGLLLARGESPVTAWSYPFGIDGLLIGAAVVLWQIRTDTETPGPTAVIGSPVQTPVPGRALSPVQVTDASTGQVRTQVRTEDRSDAGTATGQVKTAATRVTGTGLVSGRVPATRPQARSGQPATVENLTKAIRTGQLTHVTRDEVMTHYGIGTEKARKLLKEYKEGHETKAGDTP